MKFKVGQKVVYLKSRNNYDRNGWNWDIGLDKQIFTIRKVYVDSYYMEVLPFSFAEEWLIPYEEPILPDKLFEI